MQQHKVQNVEYSTFHLLQQLMQIVIVKWQGTLHTTKSILPLTYYLHTTNSLIASHLLPLINV